MHRTRIILYNFAFIVKLFEVSSCKTREIIVYSRSTINACSLLSHEWWVPLIKFMVGPIIHVRARIYGTSEVPNNFPVRLNIILSQTNIINEKISILLLQYDFN